MFNVKVSDITENLGRRLKNARLKNSDSKNSDSKKKFAFRIGVSIPTLSRMEQGDPSVSIDTWSKALSILVILEDFDQLIVPEESLFAQYRALGEIKRRQRVKKRS